jgi:HK97 family phage portal protein
VSALEWLFGAPQSKLDRLPSGSILRTGGGGAWTIMGGASAGTGLPIVNEQTAQSVTAVNACVKLLAGAVASLPMNIYTMNFTNGAKSQVWGDELWWILNEAFHPQWPASAGWDFMMRSRLFHGDAYAVIERNRAGGVVSLHPVSKARVVTYEMDNGRLVYAIYPDAKASSSEVEYYDQDDMLHVPGSGYDGISSPSVLQYELRSAASTALAAQDQAGRFFANGMMPGFVISAPDKPGPEQMENLRKQLQDGHAGVKNAHKPMLLFGGMTAKELTVTPEDAQLLESRKFGVEEIARIYGVPPFMIGHNEKTTSWGSGVEAMGSGFVRYTLRNHLHAFTNEFNRKLFRRGNRFCEFDTSDLEKPSFKEFMDALRTGVGRAGERPIMTQNEARERFNLPPAAGGDSLDPLPSGGNTGGAGNE